MNRASLLTALAVVAVFAPRWPFGPGAVLAWDGDPTPAPRSAPPLPPPAGPASPAGALTPPTEPPPPAAPAPSPVSASPAGPRAAGPHIEFERKAHDFGIIKQNQDLKATVSYTNVGTAALHLTARGECSCAQVSATKKTLEPGESGVLELTFHSYGFVGKLTKHVRVETDDAEQPETFIALTADIGAGILVEPSNFYFNAMLVGGSPTSTVKVKYREGVGRPFKIKDVVATGKGVADIRFDAKPFFEGLWRGYEVTMRFASVPPAGTVSGEALIHTDDPDYASLKCLVGGLVSGRVSLSQQVTSVGIPQEGKEVTLKISCQGFDATVELGNVVAKSRRGVVAAKAVRDPANAKAWIIEITLPGTTPVGVVDDVIEVTTDVTGEEHHEIKVGGTVIAAPK